VETTIIIDGPSLVHLAAHVREFKGHGEDMFTRFVDYLCCNLPKGPRHLHVAWGWGVSARRVEANAGYQGVGYDRALADSDGMSSLRKLLVAVGAEQHEFSGAESRDVVAHLCKQVEGPTVVHSSDRSLLQIVDDATVVRDPYSGKVWDRWAVRDEFGVDPSLLADYLAFCGEPILGLAGVSGVTRSRIASVVDERGGVDQVYAEPLHKLDQKEKSKFAAFRSTAQANRTVLELEHLEEVETTEGAYDEDGIRSACEGSSVEAKDLVKLVRTQGFARTNDASQLH